MMSDLAGVLRRLSAVLAGAALMAGATAATAQASYGEIGRFGEKDLVGNPEAAAIGVNPKDNSVYVVDLPDEKDEFRIQKFEDVGGTYKDVASEKFKPHDASGSEEPDIVEGVAVDPEKERVYVLAVELRPSTEKKIDPGADAAAELYAFSTKQSGEKLVPAPGTEQTGKEEAVLAGTTVLDPLSNKPGESLLEPEGIAVDPTTHDVIILGAEEKVEGEERVALERVSEAGVLGERWVDGVDETEPYFECEATSPAVSSSGDVYVVNSCDEDEIAEIPKDFASDAPPTPFIKFENLDEVLTSFPGSPSPESGGALSIGEEGTIYSRADIVEQLEGKKTGYRYKGVLEFNSKGEEEGWTGGQSPASDGENGPCQIINEEPQIAAGKDHIVFVYDPRTQKEAARVIEFGPTGSGCPTASATVPVATVNGVPVPESEPIPIADTVTLSSELTQANALKVEWKFGDETEQVQGTPQYQTPEVAHKFAKSGELEMTEKIYTDDLETPVIEEHRKIDIVSAKPTVVTGEAKAVGNTTATLNGTVNPNGEKVTACEFKYGTSEADESEKAACKPSSLGTGASPVDVSAEITGLTENATYYFRLSATSEGGASENTLSSKFKTTQVVVPEVRTEAATAITQTTTTLNAKVNPEGGEVTECYFEYGTSTSYGSKASCASLPGAGADPVAVSAAVSGLSPSTTYHFRIVAKNGGGTKSGTDESFATAAEESKIIVPIKESEPPPPAKEVLPIITSKPPAVPDATLASNSASVSSTGAFTLKVSCPAEETSCSGTVTLKTLKAVVASAGREAKSKASILTLATGSFTVAGGHTETLTLHLSAKARTLLAREHVLGARATILAHDPAGATHTTTVTVTLRAAKAAKHH